MNAEAKADPPASDEHHAIEVSIQENLIEFAQMVHDKFGVALDRVEFKYIDVSTMVETKVRFYQVQVTSTFKV